MPFKPHIVGRLIDNGEHEKAKRVVREAYVAQEGNTTHSARVLGVHRSTLLRWVAKLGMDEEIEKIRVEAWNHNLGGS